MSTEPGVTARLNELQQRFERYAYDLLTEERRVWAGLKKTSESAAVQERYADLFTKRQLAAAKTLEEKAVGQQREIARRLSVMLEEGYLYQRLAAADDRLKTALLKTTVTVDKERVPYFNLQPRWEKEPNFARRDRLFDAALEVRRDHLPEQQAMLETTLATLRDDFAAPDYLAYNERIKPFRYQPFRVMLLATAVKLRPLYERRMGERSQQVLKKPLGTARSVHAMYCIRFTEHDKLFPKTKLTPTLHQTLAGLGFDLAKLANIRVDTVDRPNKNPRAVCFASDPPKEVHLIIKPVGGVYDYEAFFHEAGHALHYGHARASLPLAFRLLSTSSALTEVYSYLFEHLIYEPAWLEDFLGFDPDLARKVATQARLGNLFMFLRYVAKLDYELDFFREPTDWQRNKRLYHDKLTAATGFAYEPDNFLDDMDSGLYSADYLRAWVTQAQLTAYLRGKYGRRWFADQRTGKFLWELWAEGVRPANEDIARRIGAKPHDPGALQEFFTELLK